MMNDTSQSHPRQDLDVLHRLKLLTTVDAALLTIKAGRLHVALFQREQHEFAGAWALPGAIIDAALDDDVGAAAARALKTKTGLEGLWLEQLQVFSGRFRDPRGWSLSVAHYALTPLATLEAAASQGLRLVDAQKMPALPFDHNEIVKTAVERVRSKASYSSIATHLLGAEFTMAQLLWAQESILGEKVNASNFRRKVLEMGFLEEVPGKMHQEGRMKPAKLYRLNRTAKKTLQVRGRGLSAT